MSIWRYPSANCIRYVMYCSESNGCFKGQRPI